jgi:hypothetical protein
MTPAHPARLVTAAFALALFTGRAHAQSAQALAQLTVVDSANGSPVEHAEILFLGTPITRVTDAGGRVQLQLEPGSYLVRTRRIGFAPRTARLDITGTDTLTVIVVLAPLGIALPEILVRATEERYVGKLSSFAHRMRTSGAPRSSFITREEIDDKRPRQVSDLLRVRSARAQQCAERGAVYLDGIALTSLRVAARGDRRPTIDEIPIDQIEAIEIYVGASEVPAQYNMTAQRGRQPGCVILIWTR